MCFENTMWFHLECKSNCLFFFFLLTPSTTEPADVTRMVVDSINPHTYKSMCYTVDGVVWREISLIYVIRNLSNTILLNYVWCSCLRACLSDEWGLVIILTELPFLVPRSLFGAWVSIYECCVCSPPNVRCAVCWKVRMGSGFKDSSWIKLQHVALRKIKTQTEQSRPSDQCPEISASGGYQLSIPANGRFMCDLLR